MDGIIINDFSFNSPGIERMIRLLDNYSKMIDKAMSSIKPVLERLSKILSMIEKHIEPINKVIIRNYNFLELSIPSLSISIFSYNVLPQGPPIEEKTIKEMAIENFKYNMNRYKNHKITKLIKNELAALLRELFYAYIIYLFSKALGMQ